MTNNGAYHMNTENITHQASNRLPCILRIAEVEKRTGYKRCYIYRLMKHNKFPKSYRIGDRAVGWNSEEINAWVSERIAQHN